MGLQAVYIAAAIQEGVGNISTWLSLHTSAPGDTGEFEVTEDGYGRAAPRASDGYSSLRVVEGSDPVEVRNAEEIVFGKTLTSWTNPVTHVGMWSEEFGGIWYGGFALDAPVEPGEDGIVQFPAGTFGFMLNA